MKKRLSKILACIILVTIISSLFNGVYVTVSAASNSYYVNSNAGNASDTGPGSSTQPWKSMAAVTSHTFNPGDIIYFADGSSYSGTMTLSSSGNSTTPIYLESYGTGSKPLFSNPGGLYVFDITSSYIVIDGLMFENATTMTVWNDSNYASSGSVFIEQNANNVTVQNSEFTNVGVGIKSYGLYTLVTHDYFHDLCIAYHDTSISYGAIGVSINNSNATVSYNNFLNCYSTNSPYGADGGCIEIEGKTNAKNNIAINHNTSFGSCGFCEVTETTASNVNLSYNISDDYQEFLAFDTTDTPSGFEVDNNTIVRDHKTNTTDIFCILYYSVTGPTPDSTWLNFSNNVIYNPAEKVLNGTYSYKYYDFPHDHNIYYDGTSDPVGYALGTGDKIADPQMVNPGNLNYNLSSTSPAIDAAASLGYTSDIYNNTVPYGSGPDMGAIEYHGVATSEAVSDPGFENQTSSTLSAPWHSEGTATYGVDYRAGKARTGVNDAWISSNSSGQSGDIYQTITVSPNTTYKLSAYVNSSANIGNNFLIGMRNTSGGNIKQTQLTPSGTGYTQLVDTSTYTTGASETSIVIFAGYTSTAKKAMWVQLDDFSCVPQ